MNPEGENDEPIFESSEPVVAERPGFDDAALRGLLVPSNRLYGLLLDNMAEGVLAVDADGRVIYVNRALKELHGQPADAAYTQDMFSSTLYHVGGRRLHLDERPAIRLLRGEAVKDQELEIRLPGRPVVYARVNGQRILDSHGRVLGAIVTVRDASAHHEAVAALQRSESLLAEAQAIAQIGSWEWNLQQDTLQWTEETYRLYQIAPGTPVCFKDWFDRVEPDERVMVLQVIEAVLQQHSAFCFDHRYLWPNGDARIMQVRGEVITNDEGRPSRMVGTVQDITERKLAIEALHQREAELAEAQRFAKLGNWQWDLISGRMSGSDEFYRLLGLKPEDGPITFERFTELVHPDDRRRFRRVLDIASAQGRMVELDYRIVLPDGEVRYLHGQGYNRAYCDGRPIERFGTLQDCTERYEIERAKDEFLSVASHELRTPLTSIRAPLLMLAAGKIDPQTPTGRSLLELAVSNTERMVRLVNDIMDMERLARGRLSLKPEPTDAHTLAMQAAGGLDAEATAAGVTLSVHGAPVPLTADPQRIVQVLTNLLDNAIDFSPRGGTVTLTIAPQDHHVRFIVHDEGLGVPPSQREAIFNRFKQLEPSATRKKQGLGLGLPISRAIAEQHGGRLWAEGNPGEGATFILELQLSPRS